MDIIGRTDPVDRQLVGAEEYRRHGLGRRSDRHCVPNQATCNAAWQRGCGADRARIDEFAKKLVSDHPSRFGSFATLPLPHIDESLREIAYILDVLKLDGACRWALCGVFGAPGRAGRSRDYLGEYGHYHDENGANPRM
jgi:hypothetical protein